MQSYGRSRVRNHIPHVEEISEIRVEKLINLQTKILVFCVIGDRRATKKYTDVSRKLIMW